MLMKIVILYNNIWGIVTGIIVSTVLVTFLGLVALILFGNVPKWSGQGNFEDTSGTRPGRVRDMSVRGHIFRQI